VRAIKARLNESLANFREHLALARSLAERNGRVIARAKTKDGRDAEEAQNRRHQQLLWQKKGERKRKKKKKKKKKNPPIFISIPLVDRARRRSVF